MIDKETRTELEKMPCTLKCGGHFQYVSENKKGLITMICDTCIKKGLTNQIKLTVKPKVKK